jgi:hypothetical protein
MKVVIAGSRTLRKLAYVEDAVDHSPWKGLITEVVCGGAPGIDGMGRIWAFNNGVPVRVHKAEWTLYGKAAGPIRNALMAAYCDAAIVIWDGESPGSRSMIAEMKKLGKPVFERIIDECAEDCGAATLTGC